MEERVKGTETSGTDDSVLRSHYRDRNQLTDREEKLRYSLKNRRWSQIMLRIVDPWNRKVLANVVHDVRLCRNRKEKEV